MDSRPLVRLSRRRSASRVRLTIAVALLVLAVAIAVDALGGDGHPGLPLPGIGRPARAGDPFLWVPGHGAQLEARAVAGSDHVLFAKSPGGVLATAARVSSFRPLIDRAAAGSGIDPNLLEGLVFVESA